MFCGELSRNILILAWVDAWFITCHKHSHDTIILQARKEGGFAHAPAAGGGGVPDLPLCNKERELVGVGMPLKTENEVARAQGTTAVSGWKKKNAA